MTSDRIFNAPMEQPDTEQSLEQQEALQIDQKNIQNHCPNQEIKDRISIIQDIAFAEDIHTKRLNKVRSMILILKKELREKRKNSKKYIIILNRLENLINEKDLQINPHVLDYQQGALNNGKDIYNFFSISGEDFYQFRRSKLIHQKCNFFGNIIREIMTTQSENHESFLYNMRSLLTGFLLLDSKNDLDPIGYIFSYYKDDFLQPIFVTVHPNHRRKGVSKLLRLLLIDHHLNNLLENKNLRIVPRESAKDIIQPFFKTLDPEMKIEHNAWEKTIFKMNSKTVNNNIMPEFHKLGIIDIIRS